MTSFKRFGSKHVVKYAYIGISADRQRHNLLWLFKYRICPIARGKIFGIKGQPVVKSIYIQAPMNYFLIVKTTLWPWKHA